MSFDQLIIPIVILLILAVIFFLIGSFVSNVFLSPERVRANLNILIGFLFVLALVDFLIGALFTFPDSSSSDLLILFGSFLISIVTIPILFALRSVYPFDIVKKSQVKSILSIALTLVIISQLIVSLVYIYEIIALVANVDILLGFNQIFTPSITIILPNFAENDPQYVTLVLILIMRSILLLTHHFAIVM